MTTSTRLRKEPVGEVVHLRVEADHFPWDVARPVGVDLGSDGAGLTAEAAQCLVVSGVVSCRLTPGKTNVLNFYFNNR